MSLKTTHIFLKRAATEIAFYLKWLTFRINSNAECLYGCVYSFLSFFSIFKGLEPRGKLREGEEQWREKENGEDKKERMTEGWMLRCCCWWIQVLSWAGRYCLTHCPLQGERGNTTVSNENNFAGRVESCFLIRQFSFHCLKVSIMHTLFTFSYS